MKRTKKLYVLLGVLAVVALCTVGVLRYEEKQEEIKNSGEIIFDVSAEDVTAVSWECKGNALGFTKNDTWTYDEDEAFPVDGEKLEELLTWFEEFEAAFIIENVEDYGQYGLENPQCTITLTTEEETYEITLGDFSTMDSQRYVSIGDGSAYLAMEDPYDDFNAALSDFIAHDEIPELNEASKVAFEGLGDYVITKEEESLTYQEDDLYYAQLDDEKLAVDSDNMKSYLNAVDGLSLGDYVTYKATEEDLEKYGFDDPNLTITVSYPEEDEEGEKPTVEFVLAVTTDPKVIDVSDDEDFKAYVRIGDSSFIYEITAAEYKELAKMSYDDLRHQEIIWADFADITKIQAVLDGEEYEIAVSGKKDDREYEYNEEEIDIGDFESALTGLDAESFETAEADGKEEIRLILTLDNKNVSEVEIVLYRLDGSSCVAIVDGESAALVSRSQVVELAEAVNAIVLK